MDNFKEIRSKLAHMLAKMDDELADAHPLLVQYAGVEIPGDLTTVMNELGLVRSNAHCLMIRLQEYELCISVSLINNTIMSRLAYEDDTNDYSRKKQLGLHYRDVLREWGLAIYRDGNAVNLLVVANRDGTGRYVLEDKISKKRTGAYKSLKDLLPLMLTRDIPRKEGFVEQRKKKQKKE